MGENLLQIGRGGHIISRGCLWGGGEGARVANSQILTFTPLPTFRNGQGKPWSFSGMLDA
jgi:hypothetical protein